VDVAELLLEIAHFVSRVSQLGAQVDAVRHEKREHLVDVGKQAALCLHHVLCGEHRLPNVTLMALVSLESLSEWVLLPIDELKFVQVLVSGLSLTHRDLLCELLRRLDKSQEFLELRFRLVSELLEHLFDVREEDIYLLLDKLQVRIGRAPLLHLQIQVADVFLFL